MKTPHDIIHIYQDFTPEEAKAASENLDRYLKVVLSVFESTNTPTLSQNLGTLE